MALFKKGSIRRFCAYVFAIVAVMAALPSMAAAQGSRVTGVVTGADSRPIADAQVMIMNTAYKAVTDANGAFSIAGVPAGRYELRVARIGEVPRTVLIDVIGSETVANVQLTRAAIDLGGVTVSASRRAEKVTEAPATVTVINTDALDASVGNTFASALKEAKGLDFIQVGMTAVAINARGFNSAFNNRFLMVEDGRIAVLPENGLPVGSFTATPKVDLAGMEVLVGPGSALYGPDASNGVLSLTTKDPRQFPGATIEASGGSRSYRDVQGRYAGVFADGKLGFKVAGEYQAANDWENYLSYNAGGSIVPAGTAGSVREDALKIPIDWDAGVRRGTAALVYYSGANRLEVNGGMSKTDGVGQTNVGRNQLKDWGYNVLQAKFTSPRVFLNVYRTQSQSGESFALNRYAGAQLGNAALSPDSLRLLSDWPSDGRMYAAEAQGNYTVKPLLNTAVVFGAQYRRDQVSSDRQWLTDRISKEDIKNDQKGIYAQSTTPVHKLLDVVLAGRLDYPENYDRQFSPKAGVIFKPITDHALRVTYNRAYKSPTILQTDFFIPDWTGIISIYGNTTGFQMTRADGSVVATYDAMKPETNKTWEFGYKGVLVNRLYVDGTYFRSNYKNFMSPLTIIGNPFAAAAAGGPTFAKPLSNPNGIPVNPAGQIINQAATPIAPIVLTYYNLGDAKVSGVDLGLSAIVTDRIELRGTASTVKINEVTVPTGGSLEAVSLNSPTTKWTAGATARDFGPVSGGLTWRNTNGYYFRSGTNTGVIPTFGTLDASLSVKMPRLENSLINLSVGNLLTCSALNVQYEPISAAFPQPNQRIASEDRKCGFDRKHREMINMPEIGMMAFLGVRFNVNPTFR